MAFAKEGSGNYNNAFREEYDANCAINAGPEQQPGRVFTHIPNACRSPSRAQHAKPNL
jgi:hypothetical protein